MSGASGGEGPEAPSPPVTHADLPGFRLRARGATGACLEAGTLWLRLSPTAQPSPATDYTHIALDIAETDFAARIAAVAPQWQDRPSLYFSDSDGHRLELHSRTLQSCLANYQVNPFPSMTPD